jgi:two-component system phosphate regulon sensor histidine kinase PhoR
MNKARFRLLVFFMSLSLIGIILVQLYWVNSSLKNNDQQFKYHIQQILGNVSAKVQEHEASDFYKLYSKFKDSTGRAPSKNDLLPYYRSKVADGEDNNQDLVSDPVAGSGANTNATDTTAKSGTKVAGYTGANAPGKNRIDLVEKVQFEAIFNDYRELKPVEARVSEEELKKILAAELHQNDVDTPFEFAVYKDDRATNIRSDNFKWDPESGFDADFLSDEGDHSRYKLRVSFPQKEVFLFSSLIGITSLSLVFTLIIIIAYLSAINQLIKQKQISEIKTDFINNMTHEFKTPIATINLALDAIKNPKIFDDKEKVQRYLQMIRDENKRMHAQVENVLQISKLDKKELDIVKDQADIHEIIDDAIEHVNLIIEARQGTLTRHFNAQRTTTLLNDMHFTNVLVNILDNAIKYSPDEPVIDVYTENVKDFIMIRITDKGLGMSKVTLKRIFEKFYREHTGDVHNVKGHGLGLAYVKRIIDDHNCNIYVESEKGKGSTFIIKMPLIN